MRYLFSAAPHNLFANKSLKTIFAQREDSGFRAASDGQKTQPSAFYQRRR
ncbi:hypothetical protein PTET_b0135 [Pseudoalteromonas tetraodonis]|nr:hypothetical protein PTET_b0135 [Pseudoalteromonas tetraodonis]